MPDTATGLQPIGVLDSGVGGLSILREIRAQLPAEDVLYIADQAHVPYGTRPIEEVRELTFGVVRFLLAQRVKLVVVACNTASAAALYPLRARFPEMPFVGMEPAVKPAARDTRSGVIGVIATEATFQGELFRSVVGRFARDVRVATRACPEFVRLAEAGATDSPEAYRAVRACLEPLRAEGIDQLVLGCTHFPFLKDTIQAVIGPEVTIVDPSAAVARQAGRVLRTKAALKGRERGGRVTYFTSGDTATFRRALAALLGEAEAGAADVRRVVWRGVVLASG